MSTSYFSYLNRYDTSPMYHRLLRQIAESKQGRASGAQWLAWVAGLGQKGVKAAEIKMAELAAMLDPKAVYTRDQIQDIASRMMVGVREMRLSKPLFEHYKNGTGEYAEYLYNIVSERDFVQDQIQQVVWELNDLNFNMEKLMEEPDLVERLSGQLEDLKRNLMVATDFAIHHYADDVDEKHSKNLIAHARVTINDGLYFIEEIQSDWSQSGRKSSGRIGEDGKTLNKFEAGLVPEGPYVMNTEDWAGLVLRRHMQIAALDPRVKAFGWIRSDMRNGGRFDRNDGLHVFYGQIIPKIASKALAGCDSKLGLRSFQFARKTEEVPVFEMTPGTREKLIAQQPMFSMMSTQEQISPSDELKNRVLRQCHEMLGNVASVRIIDRCFDIATGRRVAGMYTNRQVLLSEKAADIEYTGNHEVFHAAVDLMMTSDEIRMIHERFAPGSELNFRVKERLTQMGEMGAAAQCEDPEESAAHGFALWKKGALDISDAPVKGLFAEVAQTMGEFARWIRKSVFGAGYQSPEELFDALSGGEVAARRMAQLREFHGMKN